MNTRTHSRNPPNFGESNHLLRLGMYKNISSYGRSFGKSQLGKSQLGKWKFQRTAESSKSLFSLHTLLAYEWSMVTVLDRCMFWMLLSTSSSICVTMGKGQILYRNINYSLSFDKDIRF
jgi:hypothetical protein